MLVSSFQFYPIPRGNLKPAIPHSPLFVYPNNQQHFRYHHSTGTSPFDIDSTYNNQYVLMLPASPPRCGCGCGSSLKTFFARSMQAGNIEKNMGYESVSTLSTQDPQSWNFWGLTATHTMPTMDFISTGVKCSSMSPGQSTTVVNGRTRSKAVLYGDRKWPAYTTTVYGGIRRETDFVYGYRGKIRYVQVSKLKLPYTVANNDRVRPYITAHDRVHL